MPELNVIKHNLDEKLANVEKEEKCETDSAYGSAEPSTSGISPGNLYMRYGKMKLEEGKDDESKYWKDDESGDDGHIKIEMDIDEEQHIDKGNNLRLDIIGKCHLRTCQYQALDGGGFILTFFKLKSL